DPGRPPHPHGRIRIHPRRARFAAIPFHPARPHWPVAAKPHHGTLARSAAEPDKRPGPFISAHAREGPQGHGSVERHRTGPGRLRVAGNVCSPSVRPLVTAATVGAVARSVQRSPYSPT